MLQNECAQKIAARDQYLLELETYKTFSLPMDVLEISEIEQEENNNVPQEYEDIAMEALQ